MPSHSDPSPHQQSAQAIVRFILRIALLCIFAAFGSQGFARTLAMLLFVGAVYCAVIGIIRREWPLGSDLTHWDEAFAYGAIACLARGAG